MHIDTKNEQARSSCSMTIFSELPSSLPEILNIYVRVLIAGSFKYDAK